MVSEWMINEWMFKMLCRKCCEGKKEGMIMVYIYLWFIELEIFELYIKE